MKARITKWITLPENEPIYAEAATTVEIVDLAGGEFIKVSQFEGEISIEPREWPMLCATINTAINEIKNNETTKP